MKLCAARTRERARKKRNCNLHHAPGFSFAAAARTSSLLGQRGPVGGREGKGTRLASEGSSLSGETQADPLVRFPSSAPYLLAEKRRMQITPVRCWLLVAACKVLFWGKAGMHPPPASAEREREKHPSCPPGRRSHHLVARQVLEYGRGEPIATIRQPERREGGRGEREENRNVRKTVSAARCALSAER